MRGKTFHSDRYGLSYWIWDYERAITTPVGEPRTDDSGVLDQIQNIYRIVREITDSSTSRRASIDVGAYTGVISLAMAQFGDNDHTVHSFEADDLNFNHLEENISSDVDGRIVAHNVAVSDHSGIAVFTRNKDHGTNHLGTPSAGNGDSEVVYEVPVDSLDNFAANNDIQEIDIVKIDVEGSDIKVLRGAEKLMSSGRIKAVITEIPLSEQGRSEMTRLLRGHGYSTAYIGRNSPRLVDSTEVVYMSERRRPLNMLAARADVAAILEYPTGQNFGDD